MADRLADVHTPRQVPADAATFLYWHGGGYVSCSPRTHRDMLSSIAHVTRARVIAPSYPMAPVSPYPAAVDTAVECYRALLASGVPADRMIVGGDSAGGGLALAMLLRLREAGDPLPRAMGCSRRGSTSRERRSCSRTPYDYLPRTLSNPARSVPGTSAAHPFISPIPPSSTVAFDAGGDGGSSVQV